MNFKCYVYDFNEQDFIYFLYYPKCLVIHTILCSGWKGIDRVWSYWFRDFTIKRTIFIYPLFFIFHVLNDVLSDLEAIFFFLEFMTKTL